MAYRGLSRSVAVTGLLILAACQGVPKSGPNAHAIKANAIIYEAAKGRPLQDYALVDITESIAAYFDKPDVPGFGATFGRGRGGAPQQRLGVGDTIQVTLFESSAGGLFIPAEAGSRPGNFISLPQQTIVSDGSITVPYAGRIPVAGRTPAEVEDTIERRLADRAIEPQAVITLSESRANQVSVLGDVNTPNQFTLSPGGERLLDLISRAGGVSGPARESYVTLQRGGRTSTVYFDRLLGTPSENVFIFPGDTIFVNRDRRTFVAVGASGLNGRFDFDESNLTLAEAIGKAGGLEDTRAEPREVFVYRLVPPEIAASIGLPASAKESSAGFPVIFRLNLRDPSGFFLAQRFAMQDKDILYIDNARSTDIVKVLSVFNAASASTLGTASDVRILTRN